MQAVTYQRYGGPEVLNVSTLDRPVPDEHQLLIRVRATEVTKSESELRSMHYPVSWFKPMIRLGMGWRRPRRSILGMYFAGDVVEVGRSVRGVEQGTAVYGTTSFRMGTYAEYLCMDARNTVLPMPSNTLHIDAAAALLGGFNALHFMNLANVERGMRVLINGAGGSIGTHAIQIARARGAHVTAADFPRKEAAIRGFGADAFIDCTTSELDNVRDAFDVVFDMVVLPAGEPGAFQRRLSWVRDGGCYLTGNPRLLQMLRAPWITRFGGKTVRFRFAGESRADLRELTNAIEAGEIRSIVDSTVTMDGIRDAHRRVETEDRIGAIVLTP